MAKRSTWNLFGLPKKPLIKPADIWGKTSSSKKRSSCPKAVKETVWRKNFGNRMTGKCHVCKKPIHFTDFEVGHNRPFSKGGTWNINNLRPICRTCNRSMGTMSIEAFKRKYFAKKRAMKKKITRRKKRAQPRGLYWVNPLTGKKEPLF